MICVRRHKRQQKQGLSGRPMLPLLTQKKRWRIEGCSCRCAAARCVVCLKRFDEFAGSEYVGRLRLIGRIGLQQLRR